MTYIQNTHDHHRQFYRNRKLYFETTQTLTLNCNKNIAAFSCTECNNNSFQNQFKHQMEGSSDTLTKPPLSRYSPTDVAVTGGERAIDYLMRTFTRERFKELASSCQVQRSRPPLVKIKSCSNIAPLCLFVSLNSCEALRPPASLRGARTENASARGSVSGRRARLAVFFLYIFKLAKCRQKSKFQNSKVTK